MPCSTQCTLKPLRTALPSHSRTSDILLDSCERHRPLCRSQRLRQRARRCSRWIQACQDSLRRLGIKKRQRAPSKECRGRRTETHIRDRTQCQCTGSSGVSAHARTHSRGLASQTHIPNLARDMTTRGASAALLAVRRLLSPKFALDTTFFHGTGGLTRCDKVDRKGRRVCSGVGAGSILEDELICRARLD